MGDDGLLRKPARSIRAERWLRRTTRAALAVKRPADDLDAVGSVAIPVAAGLVEEEPPRRPLVEWRLRHRTRLYALPLASAALAAVLLAAFEPGFYRPANLHVLMQQFAVLGLVTLGQLLVLLVGGIDLSVGAVMNASLVVIALMNQHHSHLLLSLVACTVLGAAVGLTNGLLVSLRDVPPFAATLGMLACVEGAILVYTKGIPAGNIPASLRPVALSGVGVVPYSLIICLGIAAAFVFVLKRGTFGRMIYAVGRSPEVARRVAISTTYVRLVAYLLCGVLAAFAGIILSAYVGYVDPKIGGDYNLESIAAAVLGGVAFTGGEGGAIGALAGVLFLLVLLNVVILSSLTPFTQLIVQGVVVIVATSSFQFIKNRSTV
jgi:ribose/xylose/arabinose/galactoside ABC-type transport system permease subunit